MRTTLTLTEIVKEWIANLDALTATKDDYNRKIELWFRWLSASKIELREPRRQHILDYKQHLQSSGKSSFTVNSYVTVVKLFYSYCEEMGYYDNIGEKIKSSHNIREHYKYPLTREQSNRLLESISTYDIIGKRDKLMITLMLTNGLRTCEVNRINIEDFDKRGERTILYIQRKGRTTKRERIAVPKVIDELLEDYLSERNFEMGDPLFVTHLHGKRRSTRLSKPGISAIVKRRLRLIDINHPKITAHSLRHTCGSLMVEEGMSVEDIKDMLGHSDTKTTRIYVDMARQKRMLDHSPSNEIAKIIFGVDKKRKL